MVYLSNYLKCYIMELKLFLFSVLKTNDYILKVDWLKTESLFFIRHGNSDLFL